MNGEADENDKKRAENLRVMMDAEKRKALSFFDDPAAAMAAGVAQSAADDLIHNAMVASKGESASHIKTYDAFDIAGRSAAAFLESLPGSAGFGLIGAGGGFVGGAGVIARNARREARIAQVYGENAIQTMNGTIMVEQLQQAVDSGKLKEKAPDVQQKILREQLTGTGYEMAYIDIETATQKENGMADLKKVADAAGMSSEDLETAVAENGFLSVPTEVLSQVSSSPDLLDSVSFSPEAESMARMRETNKQVLQSYEEAMKETIQRKAEVIETLMKNTMPNATEEQRSMIEAAIMTSPDNPAQGWNTLRKEMQGQLDEILAPAIKALEAGMGNAGIMDVEDEQGNTKTVRYSENAPWYKNFYKQFKRKPTKAELEDMAIAMVTGDPSATQVQGWIADSQEVQEGLAENKAAISMLRDNIKALDDIKGEMQKLTGVEMELTAGLSPEAVSMYRQIYDWAKSVGGNTARQARMGAILAARHADIYARLVTEKTGRKYTAADYMREKLGFSIRQAGGGMNQSAGELAAVKLKRDSRRWWRKVDEYVESDKTEWHNTNNGDLYDFMDVPLVLQILGVDFDNIKVYGSFFAHSLERHPGMEPEMLKEFPAKMADPLMVLEGSKPNSYVFVLELKNANDATIVVPVEICKADRNYGVIDVAESAYGKDGANGMPSFSWLIKAFENNKVLYMNTPKSALWQGPYRSYFPAADQLKNAFDDFIVSDGYANVKTEKDLEAAKAANTTMYQLPGYKRGLLYPKKMMEEVQKFKTSKAVLVEVGKISVSEDKAKARKRAKEEWRKKYPDDVMIPTVIGDVKITARSIKDSLSHGYGKKKLDAVLSLKEGMKSASYMDSLKDFDGDNIINHYFLYKADYGGELNYVICRVKENEYGAKKLYIHEVVSAKEISNALQTRPADNNQLQPRGIALYMDIITDFIAKGKREREAVCVKFFSIRHNLAIS